VGKRKHAEKELMRLIIFLFSLFSLTAAWSQTETDIQLAQHYYASGELDKALPYYEKIYNSSPTKVYFNRYFECLVSTKDYKSAEKLLKKQINQNRSDYDMKVILAQFYEDIGEAEKAEKSYKEIIDNLPENPSQIINIYQTLASKQKFEMAKTVLDKGKKLLSYYPFNFQYADLYAQMGKKKEMIAEYLDYLEQQPTTIESIEASLAARLDLSASENADYMLLKEQLLTKSQKMNASVVFSELLIWMYTQSKNFDGAYTQVVAIDKRFKGDGYRVFELGEICVENKNYQVARKCFNYVISLGENSENYILAYKGLLNTHFLQITTNRNFSKSEIDSTVITYEQALNKLGKSRLTLPVVLEYTTILAFYADQSDKAQEELKSAMNFSGLTDVQKAQIKMQLADINVLSGDIWEASILYMQIDNDFKFESIGQEAKFKNAKVFYYDGEFDYAQAQLNVLKESTSKLIANDAMQLSVMITDNYGLDSNFQVMSWFSNADLLIEQHKYDEAFKLYDSIQINFPYHSLADEILFKKGKAMEMRGEWQKALDYYEDLLKFHGQDILADDALFRSGDIQENNFSNKEKALEFYRRLAIDYKGSLYSAEARKRIRLLRGDKNVSDDEL
jgi:tetratricopeptide (TPR) repeat protein